MNDKEEEKLFEYIINLLSKFVLMNPGRDLYLSHIQLNLKPQKTFLFKMLGLVRN